MAVLGGSLKRRERISARLGDVLSQLYLASAVLKRYDDEGRHEADLPLVHWGVQDALYRAEQAMDDLLQNFPKPRRGRIAHRDDLPDWPSLSGAV
ncbi:acyl-CoA dehydrogenase domain-containing protein [Salmonella enterica]|uniref:acyl-CoA dehydrogenase domain-containing protein n=1 Tax=Salmonella enterica TaxID=28901 RepID=UPI001F3354C8|nr:acyl-CoA dehydrogenase domain-containing protein [Salmonella enterica]